MLDIDDFLHKFLLKTVSDIFIVLAEDFFGSSLIDDKDTIIRLDTSSI